MFRQVANAKLDLAIHVTPKKKDDGYYPVHYIDCQIDLCDELIFDAQRERIDVICESPDVGGEKENFVYRTAQNLKRIVGRKELGARITLKKNIPVRGGFGGGGSDGAAALSGLCRLWKIKKTDNLVGALARDLGKDFYYSAYGQLGEVLGRGKEYKIMPLGVPMAQFWLVILVPKEVKPSTGWVYDHLKLKNIGRNSGRIGKLKTALLKRDKMGILKNLTNDFEDTVSSYYPVISQMKDDLIESGAGAAIMAGAGLSVVGFFDSRRAAIAAKKEIGEKYAQSLVARTIS